MTQTQSTGWGEWDGAVYLLGTPLIAGKTAPFIDHDEQEIRWTQLLEASVPWSSGERWLVRAAQSIWGSADDQKVSLGYAVNYLDEGNFRRFVDAMRLARGEPVGDP
jgi:hypothetical protein